MQKATLIEEAWGPAPTNNNQIPILPQSLPQTTNTTPNLFLSNSPPLTYQQTEEVIAAPNMMEDIQLMMQQTEQKIMNSLGTFYRSSNDQMSKLLQRATTMEDEKQEKDASTRPFLISILVLIVVFGLLGLLAFMNMGKKIKFLQKTVAPNFDMVTFNS